MGSRKRSFRKSVGDVSLTQWTKLATAVVYVVAGVIAYNMISGIKDVNAAVSFATIATLVVLAFERLMDFVAGYDDSEVRCHCDDD